MSTSWTICMGDYPEGFANAQLLVATFQGLAMVAPCDGYDAQYTVMLESDDGTCPVEVTPESFAGIAVCKAHGVSGAKPLIALQRCTSAVRFSFIGFLDVAEAPDFIAQTRRAECS